MKEHDIRHRYTAALYVLMVLLLVSVSATATSQPLAHVTFASCNRQGDSQAFWRSVIAKTLAAQQHVEEAEARTDVLLWTGNAVYASISDSQVELVSPRSPHEIAAQYRILSDNTDYQYFLSNILGIDADSTEMNEGAKEKTKDKKRLSGKVMGVWDDHDLGLRGADKNYSQTAEVKQVYLDFIHADSALVADVTNRNALYYFSTVPVSPDTLLARAYENSVCTIVLDVHAQRGSLPHLSEVLVKAQQQSIMHSKRSSTEISKTDSNEVDDLLGEEQWAWLEEVVASKVSARATSLDGSGRAACAVTLIVSAWQILLNDNKPFAGWDVYPASRSRLLALLQRHEAARFIFVTGHAEAGEVGVMTRPTEEDAYVEGFRSLYAKRFAADSPTKYSATLLPIGNPLVEVTSSGLTHTVAEAPIVGRFYNYAVKPVIQENEKSINFFTRFVYLNRRSTTQRNFGTIQILPPARGGAESNVERCRVVITVHSAMDGSALLTHNTTLEELPTYAGNEAVAPDGIYTSIPQFTIYNAPGERPWIKSFVIKHQCLEVPCIKGKYFIFFRIGATLATAAAVFALAIIAAVVYNSRYMKRKRRQWRRRREAAVRAGKAKHD